MAPGRLGYAAAGAACGMRRTNCRLRFLCWKQSSNCTRCGLRSSFSSLISLSAVTLIPCGKRSGGCSFNTYTPWQQERRALRCTPQQCIGIPIRVEAGSHLSGVLKVDLLDGNNLPRLRARAHPRHLSWHRRSSHWLVCV